MRLIVFLQIWPGSHDRLAVHYRSRSRPGFTRESTA